MVLDNWLDNWPSNEDKKFKEKCDALSSEIDDLQLQIDSGNLGTEANKVMRKKISELKQELEFLIASRNEKIIPTTPEEIRAGISIKQIEQLLVSNQWVPWNWPWMPWWQTLDQIEKNQWCI